MRILILGSGLIGVTSAYWLMRDGHEVTVVDRCAGPAMETSFANAGLIAPGHAYTWNAPGAPWTLLRSLLSRDQALRLKLGADPFLWSWCWRFLRSCSAEKARRYTVAKLRLCLDSQRLLHELVRETGLSYDARRGGLLHLYRSPATLAAAAARMRLLQEHGATLRLVDADEVVRLEPAFAQARTAIAGAVYAPEDEAGDAHLFTCGLAAWCAERGAVFRFGTAVRAVAHEGGAVVGAVTDNGVLGADAVVVALGSYTPLLLRPLGIRLPVYPVKGYSATFPAGPGAPALGGIDKDRFLAWARLGGRFRITASAEIGGYDTSHAPGDVAPMVATARALFPDGADWMRPVYWAGLRPMTPTGTPLIGATRVSRLFVNTGQGHMGWTMACGSAQCLADAVAGRAGALDDPAFRAEAA